MSGMKSQMAIASVFIPIVLLLGGCACTRTLAVQTSAAPCCEKPAVAMVTQDLPPDAKMGECYAKVFVPEQFETRTESVLVRDASERLEIVPARYEWVEEKVQIKEASTRLEEVPAEFAWQDVTVEVSPGHSGWHIEKQSRCVSEAKDLNQAPDLYCLVNHEPEFKTIKQQVQVKPATVREVVIPAEYQMVRREKVAAPATTRHIPIPAQYASVEKTRKTADSRVEWQRVVCQVSRRTETLNAVKDALVVAGYEPGPRDGTFGPQDWAALKSFQRANGIGAGELTYQTMEKLGVNVSEPERVGAGAARGEKVATSH